MSDTERKANNKEGSIFCVPLFGGGYCVGLLARASKSQGRMLGYFFEPAIETISPEDAMSVVSSENVFDVMDCGNQSLESGDWPIVGILPRFSYSEWPVPIFQARDGSCVRFDQKDYDVLVDLFRDSVSSKYYKYTGYGHKAVKIVLSKKFNGRVE